jgi:hypothetical protein
MRTARLPSAPSPLLRRRTSVDVCARWSARQFSTLIFIALAFVYLEHGLPGSMLADVNAASPEDTEKKWRRRTSILPATLHKKLWREWMPAHLPQSGTALAMSGLESLFFCLRSVFGGAVELQVRSGRASHHSGAH